MDVPKQFVFRVVPNQMKENKKVNVRYFLISHKVIKDPGFGEGNIHVEDWVGQIRGLSC